MGSWDVPRIVFVCVAILMLAFACGVWGRVDDRWRTLPDGHPSLNYGQRRYRRYMQLRTLVGLTSLGMLVGLFVTHEVNRVIFLISWMGVIFLLLWIVVLGLVMAVETRVHFLRELNRKHGDEQVIRRAIRREFERDKSDRTEPNHEEPNHNA